MGDKAEQAIMLEFTLQGQDFIRAGEASSEIKQRLKKLGFKPDMVRRAAIVAYESEMNVIIHARKGTLRVEITPRKILIQALDEGPGIADIEQAMQEGFSTAPDMIRELGFGAGMGLPNIKRFADEFKIQSRVGEGTLLEIIIHADKG